MKKLNMLNLVSYGTLIASIGLVLMMIFWTTYPYKPLVLKKIPFPVENKIVHKGEFLYYTVDYCKNTDKVAKVDKSFVNDLIFFMPTTMGTNPSGCHINRVATSIPKELPTGTYHIHLEYTYEMNHFRTITIEAESEEFQVIERN